MTNKVASTVNKIANCEEISFAKNRKGFSLVELLVVVAIIGIVALIGTPYLLGMRTKSSVRADARDVHSSYRQAQTEAVKRSEDTCVVIDYGAGTYQIQLFDYFGTNLPISPMKSLRPGNEINNAGPIVGDPCFNARGLPTSGVGEITLDNPSNPSLKMAVNLTRAGHVKSTDQ